MRWRGIIWFLFFLLLLISLYQLSFTLVVWKVEKNAQKLAYNKYAHLLTPEAINNFAKNDPLKRLHYVDSINQLIKQEEKRILDSLRYQPVFNLLFTSFTYMECKEREINLGLDLKGGVSVLLQVDIPALVKELAGARTDPLFEEAFKETARKFYAGQINNFPEALREALETRKPDIRLAKYFASPETRPYLTLSSTNDDVVEYLNNEIADALQRTFNILRTRIDRFGVAQPFITMDPIRKRILLELPGIDDPYRVRKVIQTTARLEFWETYTAPQIMPYLQDASLAIDRIWGKHGTKQTDTLPDQTKEQPALLQEITKQQETISEELQANILFQYFSPVQADAQSTTPIIGYAQGKDTSTVYKMLNHPEVKKIFPRNLKFAWSAKPIDEDQDIYALYLLKSRSPNLQPALTGEVVTDARVDFDPVTGEAVVVLTMNNEGARVWRQLTRENVGKPIAIVLDDKVYSAPVVQEEIPWGISQITGNFTVKEAQDLAMVLETGKLPAKVKILQEGVVGSLLGKEAIRASLIALVIGSLLVAIFMIFYYRIPGLITVLLLIPNLIIILGVLSSLGATITLPGLAGLVLTVGMAVDASIIIFERIKEELLQEGKGFFLAIKDGFKNSRFAIADANITTLIAGIILLWIGIGPIQGFAAVLITGILSTILTGVLVLYAIIIRWVEKHKETRIQFGYKKLTQYLASTTINWLEKRKLAYIASGILITISLLSFIIFGFKVGVEFTGGYDILLRFPEPVEIAKIRELLSKDWQGSLLVREFGTPNQVKITTQWEATPGQEEVADSLLLREIYDRLRPVMDDQISFDTFRKQYVLNFLSIGPAFARDLQKSATWATILGLAFMFVYIALRFRRWEFGLGAVLALIHDTIITLGAYSLLHSIMPISLEINQIFIGALLTIIGYSINDTVVVFDRIREVMQTRLPQRWKNIITKQQLINVFNKGITATLSRTIGTSLTTLLVIISLLLLGSESIKSFAFALFIGILVGTYSSIFVASSIAFDSLKRFTRT